MSNDLQPWDWLWDLACNIAGRLVDEVLANIKALLHSRIKNIIAIGMFILAPLKDRIDLNEALGQESLVWIVLILAFLALLNRVDDWLKIRAGIIQSSTRGPT